MRPLRIRDVYKGMILLDYAGYKFIVESVVVGDTNIRLRYRFLDGNKSTGTFSRNKDYIFTKVRRASNLIMEL